MAIKERVKSKFLFYSPPYQYYHRILSIDQSSTKCGYAIYDSDTGQIIAYGVEAFDGCYTLRAKYRRYVRVVQALLELYKPDAVVIEGIRLKHGNRINLWAIIVLAGFYALTMVISSDDLYALDTNEWKSIMVGSAIANKEADVATVQALGYLIEDDNAADAVLMALCTSKIGVEMRKLA